MRAILAAALCGFLCACGGGNQALPFARTPIDATATTWSVEMHIADYPTEAMLADAKNRLHAGAIRIDYDPAAGNAFYDTLQARAAALGLGLDFITPYPVAPFDPVAYGAAAGLAAQRYAGRHLTWEIVNEPDNFVPTMTIAQCIALETSAALAIRAADPTATILTGGTSGNDVAKGWPYGHALGKALAPYVNGIGLHPYGIAPSAFASAVADMTLATGKPAYITEWGAPGGVGLAQAMTSARDHTALFNAYEYQTQAGELDFGLIDNGAWSVFAQEALQ